MIFLMDIVRFRFSVTGALYVSASASCTSVSQDRLKSNAVPQFRQLKFNPPLQFNEVEPQAGHFMTVSGVWLNFQ